MAKKGFEYVVVGKLKAGKEASAATAEYENGRYLGGSSTFNISPTASNVKDYGDDRILETDNSVTGGAVSVELNERTIDAYCYVLGHTPDGETGVTVNADDIAPFLGIGAVGKSRRANKNKFTGKFYHKVQFHEPSDENATKQESVSFTHTTLEGELMTLENGDWKEEKEFDTLADAKQWLNTKVGIGAGSGG